MVYFTRRFVVCLTLCYFVLVLLFFVFFLFCFFLFFFFCFFLFLFFLLFFFSPFSIAITSLGGERANLIAFRTFVRFVLVGFVGFLSLFVSGKGCDL